MPLTEHPTGGYRFLPGITPYSCGVVAAPGHEIVAVTLRQPMPYADGLSCVAKFLHAQGRPKAALCGVRLRCPRPYSFEGFAEFNTAYTAILDEWKVFVDGVNPLARTNVAPAVGPPDEPVLYGFSYTQTCEIEAVPTFVVAGAGELPEGVLSRHQIVSVGDDSALGLSSKAQYVLSLMDNRLAGLGVEWSAVTAVNVYTVHDLSAVLPEIILARIGSAAMHGVRWHYTRPPVEEIEFEMDVRGTRTELWL